MKSLQPARQLILGVRRGGGGKMATRRWRTNYLLWVLAASGIFVGLSFIDPVAGASKGENSLVAYVKFVMEGGYNTPALLVAIALRSAFQVIPAALVGWLLQALAVVAWASVRAAKIAEQNAEAGRRQPR
jgi:hypothetical protein